MDERDRNWSFYYTAGLLHVVSKNTKLVKISKKKKKKLITGLSHFKAGLYTYRDGATCELTFMKAELGTVLFNKYVFIFGFNQACALLADSGYWDRVTHFTEINIKFTGTWFYV